MPDRDHRANPLTSVTGLLKGTALATLERRNRRRLRRRSKGDSRLRIFAAGASRFPVTDQTYVYEELLALRNALEAQLAFSFSEQGDPADLPDEFADLARCAHRAYHSWRILRRDLEHFRQTRPNRLEAALRGVAIATGRTVANLEKDYEVLTGIAFARRAELFDADYVHTSFFYRETLGGFFARELLGIPRGISAYGDHTLDDHRLKCVGLHLQTADILVATTNRVRDELLDMGGRRCADQILVKPDALEGARFEAHLQDRVRATLTGLKVG